MKKPLLSVIIPVYNVEKYLEKCLESVIKQSYRNLQIIAVDDCATDNSFSILKRYAEKDNRIILLQHEKNKGLFQARLTGIAAATGKYVAFVDSDDEITLDYYRVLVDKAEKENADIVMGNTIMEDENHWRFRYNSNFGLTAERTIEGNDIFENFFSNEGACFSWHTMYNKIYTKKIWDKAVPEYGFFNDKLTMTEDIAFSVALYYYAKKMCFIPHDGYIYYRHSSASTGLSVSIDNVKAKVNDVKVVFNFVEFFLKQKNIFNKYEKNYIEWKNRYFRWHSYNIKDALERFPLSEIEKEELKNKFCHDFGKDDLIFAKPEDSFFTDLKCSWNKNLEDIIGLICDDKIKIISFDIFDTLIFRPLWKPDDVFLIVQNLLKKDFPQYKNLPFYDMRIEAETSVRKKTEVTKSFFEDVTLEEIYGELSSLYRLPEDLCVQLRKLEEKVEIDYCYPRQTAKQLYELARSLGKKIIFTSDMYLSQNVVETILNKCGYRSYDHLFLSSDKRMLKATGTLFEAILSELHIQDHSTILHIGDNWNSDILCAKKYGITTYFFPKAKDIFENYVNELKTNECLGVYKKMYGSIIKYTEALKQFPIRCIIAVICNKYFDNPFYYSFYEKSNFNADPYFIGLYPLGMMAFAFTKKVLDDSCGKYRTIHFLSRDGYIFKKIYDLMKEDIKDVPQSNYVYTSRKALLPYQIKNKYDFYDICNIINICSHSPADILEIYNPILKPLTEQRKKEYFEKGILLNNKFNDMTEFVTFINAMIEISYDKEKKERNYILLQKFMKNIFSPHDATVDLGYSGRLQGILCELVGFPIDTYFLYSNGYNSNILAKEHGFSINSFYDYTPSGSVSVRESLIIENGPSCIGYEFTNSDVHPIFEEDKMTYIEKYIYGEVHRGIIDFTKEIMQHFKEWRELFDIRAAEISAPFERFICYATDFDKVIFSCCYMEDEIYGGIEKISLKEIWDQDMANCGFYDATSDPAKTTSYADKSPQIIIKEIIPQELESLYPDGIFMKFYQWINNRFPFGSKSRERMKKIASFFLRKK